MKVNKRITAVLLTILMLLVLFPEQAFAAGFIDLDQEVSLTIRNCYGGKGIPDVTFDLYLISTIDETGKLTPTAEFRDYADALDILGEKDEAWIEMADTLEKDILLGKLGELKPADSAATGQDGIVSFPAGSKSLTPGLYLVMGTHAERDNYVYSTSPFFVCLPGRNIEENEWDYTVEANAKPGKEPAIADLKVQKNWDDECHESQRPTSISIQLFCDGEPYGTPITLPVNGRWEYTWENLEMNHTWMVTEEKVDGYKEGVVRQEGNTFIITNTCDKPLTVTESRLPQTGQFWWPVFLLVAAGLLLVIIGLIRRKGSKNDEG